MEMDVDYHFCQERYIIQSECDKKERPLVPSLKFENDSVSREKESIV